MPLFKKKKLRLNLFNKIFLSIMALFISVGVITLIIFTRQQTQAIEKSTIEHHRHHAWIASINIGTGYTIAHWPFETLKKLSDTEEVIYWRIIKQDGQIYLADDAKMWGKVISHPALNTKETVVIDEIFPETGEKIKVVVNPLDIIEDGRWTFWLGFSLRSVVEARRGIILTNIVISAVAIILIGLISWYLARGITIPVRHLLEGTRVVSSGKFDYQIPIETKDEIGDLAISFKKMTENLQKTTVSRDELAKEIVERKKVEEALQESEWRYRNLYESSKDGIISSDMEGNLLDVNQALLDMVGYTKEEITKMTYQQLTPKRWHKMEEDIVKNQITKRGYSDVYEKEYIKKDGSVFPITIRVWLTKDREGRPIGMWAIVRDITERKDAERKLEEARLQLIQSEKLATLGRMAAGVAHEINNPLSVISGEAEMLLKEKDKETKSASKNIVEQSERIKTIVEGLLEFSRKRELKLSPLDINDIVGKSLSLLSYQTKLENIEIVKELGSNLPKVKGDSEQLQEVFLNIMLNAIQAMEKGGRLTIRTHSEKITELLRRKTDVFKLGQRVVVIEFKDTGIGMDEEALKRVFDPFFTTKKKNTGLGLSISYGIIQNHNGMIEAYSKLKEGSTFIVKLPISGG